jgi:hypothetical protein
MPKAWEAVGRMGAKDSVGIPGPHPSGPIKAFATAKWTPQ